MTSSSSPVWSTRLDALANKASGPLNDTEWRVSIFEVITEHLFKEKIESFYRCKSKQSFFLCFVTWANYSDIFFFFMGKSLDCFPTHRVYQTTRLWFSKCIFCHKKCLCLTIIWGNRQACTVFQQWFTHSSRMFRLEKTPVFCEFHD